MIKEHNASILQFPKSRIVRDTALLNSEELQKMKVKNLKNFIDTVTEDVSSNVLDHLEQYGIEPLTEDGITKDFILIKLAISSLVARSLEVKHPFHDFIDRHMQIDIIELNQLEDTQLDKDTEIE